MPTNSTNDNILPILTAAGGIVVEQEKLLLIRKNGKWDFPKGKKEQGELIEECAVRETSEETGLELSALRIVKLVENFNYYRTYSGVQYLKQVYLFQVLSENGMKDELHPGLKEGIDYCHWVHFSELKNLVFRPYITSFISELILKPQYVLEFNQ